MTPEQKAKELIEKYCQVYFGDIQYVNITIPKKSALICIDEIIDAMQDGDSVIVYYSSDKASEFWHNVKEEILKL